MHHEREKMATLITYVRIYGMCLQCPHRNTPTSATKSIDSLTRSSVDMYVECANESGSARAPAPAAAG